MSIPTRSFFVFPLLSRIPVDTGIKQKLCLFFNPPLGGMTTEQEAGVGLDMACQGKASEQVIAHRWIACTVVSELKLRARGACIRMRLRLAARLFQEHYNFSSEFYCFFRRSLIAALLVGEAWRSRCPWDGDGISVPAQLAQCGSCCRLRSFTQMHAISCPGDVPEFGVFPGE